MREPLRKTWLKPAVPTRTLVHSPGFSSASSSLRYVGAGHSSVAEEASLRRLARSHPLCTNIS